jgi:hypothetical protein
VRQLIAASRTLEREREGRDVMVVAAGGLASSAVIDVDGRKMLLLPQWLQTTVRTGLARTDL